TEMMMEAPAAPSFGAAAVEKAVESMALEGADMAAPAPMALPTVVAGMGGGEAAAAPAVTVAGDRAFILRDGVWTDTTFDPDKMTPVTLPFASSEFMDVLSAHPETARYFALGDEVIVVIDDAAYQTIPPDETTLSPEPAPTAAPASTAAPAPAPTVVAGGPVIAPTANRQPPATAPAVPRWTWLAGGVAGGLLLAAFALLAVTIGRRAGR
ncbi:MAG: hypothetical protein ACE5G8_15365, partial [Anaerolineae bacterium]